jgi:RNA polymerase sigma-70 factor (ECF subfamily)
MGSIPILEQAKLEGWTDEEVVARVLAGEAALFEILMRRHNQRLYRVARAILRDDAEAEDVMQDAYVRAYQHLDQFAGRARFSTWLTRIAVHEALARAQRRTRLQGMDSLTAPNGELMIPTPVGTLDPERSASNTELGRLLEDALLALPEHYRTVVMLREVEQLSTAETAEALELSQENVKVRLLRARALLRKQLYERAGASSAAAFQFQAPRCDRVVQGVFARLAALPPLTNL